MIFEADLLPRHPLWRMKSSDDAPALLLGAKTSGNHIPAVFHQPTATLFTFIDRVGFFTLRVWPFHKVGGKMPGINKRMGPLFSRLPNIIPQPKIYDRPGTNFESDIF